MWWPGECLCMISVWYQLLLVHLGPNVKVLAQKGRVFLPCLKWKGSSMNWEWENRPNFYSTFYIFIVHFIYLTCFIPGEPQVLSLKRFILRLFWFCLVSHTWRTLGFFRAQSCSSAGCSGNEQGEIRLWRGQAWSVCPGRSPGWYSPVGSIAVGSGVDLRYHLDDPNSVDRVWGLSTEGAVWEWTAQIGAVTQHPEDSGSAGLCLQ